MIRIKIRQMNIKDYEKIEKNLQKDFDEFWTESILKSEIENQRSQYILAEEDNEIVGFAGIIDLVDDVEITNIVTKKSERKKGIGKLLLDKLIDMAKKINKECISLEVNENNFPAINLYKSAGFEEIGIRKKYYNGIDNAIIMTKRLI